MTLCQKIKCLLDNILQIEKKNDIFPCSDKLVPMLSNNFLDKIIIMELKCVFDDNNVLKIVFT